MTRVSRPFLARPLLGQLLVVALLDLAIHWTLLVGYNGYISWTNFLTAYTAGQYPTGPDLAWSPYQYMGSPVFLPFQNLCVYLDAVGPLSVLSAAFGATWGAKLYIVLSVLFLGAATLVWARTLIHSRVGQIAAAVFVVAGPYQLALYGQGDYEFFVTEGVIFLSLSALWLGIHRPSQRWIWFPVSGWLLLFTFELPMAMMLGFLMTDLLLPVYLWDWRRSTRGSSPPAAAEIASAPGSVPPPPESWSGRIRRSIGPHGPARRFFSDLGGALARFPAVVAAAALLIVPAYVTFYVWGRGATSPNAAAAALPLSIFENYSRPPWSLLTLSSYFDLGPTMVSSGAHGALVLALWTVVVLALLFVLWIGYVFTGDIRLVYLLGATVFASIFGAGTAGPLSGPAVYLYFHFPGYAALNASYYWDWFVIAPIFALMLGLLLEGIFKQRALLRAPRPSEEPSREPSGGVLRYLRSPRRRRAARRGLALIAIALGVLLGLSVLLPISNGAYYTSPDGIPDFHYPSDYAQIPGLLSRLIGDSYAGVALFSPDVNWFLSNSTELVPNAFFLFPGVRTPGVPIYLAPALQSNSYFYWLYETFYENETRYAAELFALVGVEYFLVFYDTEAASFPNFLGASFNENASVLLRYQAEVEPVVQEQYFALYRNLAYNGVALADRNLSLIAGPGYQELNALAYAGVPLENQSWVFSSDLPGNGCAPELARVARVYASSPNALIAVGLQCDHVSITDPASLVSPANDTSSGWVLSTPVLGVSVLDSWSAPLAAVYHDPGSLRVPLDGNGCAMGCSIWLPVRLNGDAGSLRFSWQGSSYNLSTTTGRAGVYASMVWVELPFDVTGSGTLTITPSGGWNAVGPVYVYASGSGVNATSPEDWLAEHLATTTIVEGSPGLTIDIGSSVGSSGNLSYVTFPRDEASSEVPGGGALAANATPDTPASLSVPVVGGLPSGWIGMLARSTGGAVFQVGTPTESPQPMVGTESGGGNSSFGGWQDLYYPWDGTPRGQSSELPIRVSQGTLEIAELWTLPGNTGTPGSPGRPLAPTSAAATPVIAAVPFAWNVSDFALEGTLTVSASDGGYSVSTNGSPLVLLRISDYVSLDAGSGASLASALGTLNTLLWNPSGARTVAVTPGVTEYFELGIGISILATLAWIAIERAIAWRRRHAEGAGELGRSEAPSSAPAPAPDSGPA